MGRMVLMMDEFTQAVAVMLWIGLYFVIGYTVSCAVLALYEKDKERRQKITQSIIDETNQILAEQEYKYKEGLRAECGIIVRG